MTLEATPQAHAASAPDASASESEVGRAFSERSFYLEEFRGRALAIAAPQASLGSPAELRRVLTQLADNHTRVVLLSDDDATLAVLCDERALTADVERNQALWEEPGAWRR